ncbi:MAG: hypothetical protein AcusKO_28280 [Acuticoccus sp.]
MMDNLRAMGRMSGARAHRVPAAGAQRAAEDQHGTRGHDDDAAAPQPVRDRDGRFSLTHTYVRGSPHAGRDEDDGLIARTGLAPDASQGASSWLILAEFEDRYRSLGYQTWFPAA